MQSSSDVRKLFYVGIIAAFATLNAQATILLFFAHQALHLEPATVAMTGATVMLLVSRQSLERSLAGGVGGLLGGFVALLVAGVVAAAFETWLE